MSDNWTKLTAFVDKHRGELILGYFDLMRLDGLVDRPDDDYYFKVSGERGVKLLSCVGRVFLLKGFLPDDDYTELERAFNLNIDHWKAAQKSREE